MKLVLIIFCALLFGCKTNNKNDVINNENIIGVSDSLNVGSKSDLFIGQLNQIVDDYIIHLKSQENEKIHEQLVSLYFYVEQSDTVLIVSTGRYVGRFELDSKLDWRFYGVLDGRKIVVGDLSELIGKRLYDFDKLKEYYPENLDTLKFDYSDYYFENSIWEYRLFNNAFVKV